MTGPYCAYHAPGETFRIVCQEPCEIDERLIFAKYAGFKAVKPQLIDLMGVDVPPELLPVDIHLNGDQVCGPYKPGISTGSAGSYPTGYVCLFDIEQEYRVRPFTPDNAILREDQLLLVHEYAHIIFYHRHFASYEDVVKAVSFYIVDGRTDPCDEALRFPDQGLLIYELCKRNGFRFEHLGPSIIQLDNLYSSGGGRMSLVRKYPTTSIYQYRLILNDLLGGDTLDAFLCAGFCLEYLTTHNRPLSC